MGNTQAGTERSWIELKIENLKHNVKVLTEAMPPACELMAVVKAEAYGHGACRIATILNEMGIKAFAVATIEEGIQLRKNGICGEILILGYTSVKRASDLEKYDLIQTLIDFDYAKALNSQNVALKVHIKIDTGMHRLGFPCEEGMAVKKVFEMKHLKIGGIYTHLCCADSLQADDMAFTRRQIVRFYQLLDTLKKEKIKIPKVHIQSSYGLLDYPDLTCHYVRAGIALYGVLSAPNDETNLKPDLRPVLSLKSRVVSIRRVKKGDSVGYGRDFVAERDSQIAIVPIGYGDGFPRSLSNGNGRAAVNGHIVPIVGRICMDQLSIDITDVQGVSTGNIVTLIGAEECDDLSASAVAYRSGSISNELLCRMGARLPVIILRR